MTNGYSLCHLLVCFVIVVLCLTDQFRSQTYKRLADVASDDDVSAIHPTRSPKQTLMIIISVPTMNRRNTCSPKTPLLPEVSVSAIPRG